MEGPCPNIGRERAVDAGCRSRLLSFAPTYGAPEYLARNPSSCAAFSIDSELQLMGFMANPFARALGHGCDYSASSRSTSSPGGKYRLASDGMDATLRRSIVWSLEL
jgi:hypothetical protein